MRTFARILVTVSVNVKGVYRTHEVLWVRSRIMEIAKLQGSPYDAKDLGI
jgi:hypothetical protein